eukprot:scaffold13.g273.t1
MQVARGVRRCPHARWLHRRGTTQSAVAAAAMGTWMSPAAWGTDEQPPLPAPAPPTAAYVHLPFCHRKCKYCDFPVIAVGMNAETDHVRHNMRGYVDLVLEELRATARLNEEGPLQTVFFGGGTPSLLSLPLLEELLREIDRRFGIQPGAEISIEADPGTFDANRLRSYLGLGVTRVSVGVQAFQDQLLQLCGRAHDVADVYRAIEAIYAADVPTWSLDLMSGLPELTEDAWRASLERTLDAAPHHVSVEDHTPFARLYTPGQAPLPEEDAAARMYGTASTSLRGAGYEHYEVSNYARPGHRCKHNMVYWEGGSYYGFGLGAASYLEGRRFSRPKRLGDYRTWVAQLGAGAAAARAAQVPGTDLPAESANDWLLDTVMLRLRLADGLDLDWLAGWHPQGQEAAAIVLSALERHIEAGLVQRDRTGSSAGPAGAGAPTEAARPAGASPEGAGRPAAAGERGGGGGGVHALGRVRLADPDGFIVSNEIISDVFAALDITSSQGQDD